MLERALEKFRQIKDWQKPPYIVELEEKTSLFTQELTQGEKNKLLETEDGRLKIYHHGLELKVKPLLAATEIPTGKELVFVEFHNDGNLYHVTGGVDSLTGKFTYRSISKYSSSSKRYKDISVNKYKNVVAEISQCLQEHYNIQNSSTT